MKLFQIFFIMLLTSMLSFSQTPKKSETVTLNGSKIYYEVYGAGTPLFLLHGFTQSSISWYPFIADYEKDFEVYLVDLKGHGKSGPFIEILSLKSAAEELDALIKHLRLDHLDAIGYSYGGEILFQLALLHPGLIRSMVIIGSCGSWNAADFPEFVEYLSYKNIQNLPWMREQQRDESQIRSILEQVPHYKVFLSDEELKSIQSRVLFVWGDQDEATPLECIARARKNLPYSFLWALPNTGHGPHKDQNKDAFVKTSKQFFSPAWTK